MVENDAVGNDFIIKHQDCTVVGTETIKYMQFTYDSNDHFGTAGTSATLNGTAATEAAFETRMATIASVAGGAANDLVYINGYTGLSTAIVRYTTD